MKSHAYRLLAVALLGVAALPAVARDSRFDAMDSNHDGRVSAQEHAAWARAMFLRMDADHDGDLAGAEWSGGHPMRGAGMGGGWMGQMGLAQMDADHDGAVTAAEHAAAAQAMFARMDANHDGRLTGSELMPGHSMPQAGMKAGDKGAAGMPHAGMPHAGMTGSQAMQAHTGHPPAGHGHMPSGAQVQGMPGHAMAMTIDANHDGRISEAEHAAAAQAMFAQADTDHDGMLTRAEFEAAHAGMGRAHKRTMPAPASSGQATPPPGGEGH